MPFLRDESQEPAHRLEGEELKPGLACMSGDPVKTSLTPPQTPLGKRCEAWLLVSGPLANREPSVRDSWAVAEHSDGCEHAETLYCYLRGPKTARWAQPPGKAGGPSDSRGPRTFCRRAAPWTGWTQQVAAADVRGAQLQKKEELGGRLSTYFLEEIRSRS